nr:hypothetical protein A6C57_24400 [Fibrella sp. ES10-3-2-2]
MNMEFTHKYTGRADGNSLRSTIKRYFQQFVNQNAAGFEAYSRTGAPFGGNALIAAQPSNGSQPSISPQDELVVIQQQLYALTNQVVQLTEKLDQAQATLAHQPAKPHREPTPARQIGIYRFWALQKQQATA